MRLLATLLLALLLAGCASVSRVQGVQVVNERLAVTVDAAWNEVHDPWEADPYDTWTQEGIPLDHLRFWGGVRPGQPLMTRPMVFLREEDQRAPRIPTFRTGMADDQLVALFEELYAAAGTVTLTRLEPTVFAGQRGIRFAFDLLRRRDDLPMRGVGWVAVVRDGEQGEALHAATFVAPRAGFFARLLPVAEAVVRTARIRRPDAPRLTRAGWPPS